MPIVITSTPATDLESLILDGLELNGSPFTLESIDFGIPASLAEWVKGADSNGAILGRPPLYENRVIEARISVQQQATMDAALGHIATIEDKLLECAQNANGLSLVWSPAESTLPAITFRCLLGEIVDMPISWESRYFAKAPEFGIRLTCLPFGEGAEYLAGSVTNSDPMQTLELTGVPGDVPALGRLVVTDAATQTRRYVTWGLESRWLNVTSAPPALLIDSTSLPAYYTGSVGTRAGAYSGETNNVMSATLRTQSQPIVDIGDLTHVGTFRAQMRFYATATTMAVRLSFRALDGPLRSLGYRVPAVAGWNHVDLGMVTIPQAPSGTQRWTGRIEAYSTATGGETLDIDYLALMPVESFGRARATYSYAPAWIKGRDEFTTFTAGIPLSGRTAPEGGTWFTYGDATDFAAADAPVATDETVSRSASGTRVALLGSTFYTNGEISTYVYGGVTGPGTISFSAGVMARWINDSNYLTASYVPSGWGGPDEYHVVQRVAGVQTTLATVTTGSSLGQWHGIRLVVFAAGTGVLFVLDTSGNVVTSARFASTALATGGAIASGRTGLVDTGNSASVRYYDNFSVGQPPAEPIVCHANQSIEFRHNTTLREDSTGTYVGQPPEYVGSRFYVPNAGGPGRKTRVAVIARRNDVVAAADDSIADSTTVQVYATPRYLAVPRA